METFEKIRNAYTEFVLENGHQPPSVFAFAKKLDIAEAEFYTHYGSFDAIEADIWLAAFDQTRQKLEADPTYQTYSVREKLLAFYYTWIEVLKAQRSFVVYSVGRLRDGMTRPSMAGSMAQRGTVTLGSNSRTLMPFRDAFNDFIRDLLAEGRESREVEPRPFVTERYPTALWAQTLFVLDFWVRDVSRNFEQTDTAIEKSVNTAFDLIGRSPLDSLFDLAKFVYQNR
jgi:AcrR family transcriptional regulator